MVGLIGLPKAGSWLDIDLTDEIAVAMRWFRVTPFEAIKANAQAPIIPTVMTVDRHGPIYACLLM